MKDSDKRAKKSINGITGFGVGMHSCLHVGCTGASNRETQGISSTRTFGRNRVAWQANGILQSRES